MRDFEIVNRYYEMLNRPLSLWDAQARMQGYMQQMQVIAAALLNLWTLMLSQKSSKFPPVIVWMKTKACLTPHPASTETHIDGSTIGHSTRISSTRISVADQTHDVDTHTFL